MNEIQPEEIILSALGLKPIGLEKISKGRTHQVFSFGTNEEGKILIIRLASPNHIKSLRGYLYWDSQLKKLGLKTANVLFSDIDCQKFGVPFVILEKLPGLELAECCSTLSSEEVRRIAKEYVLIQKTISEGISEGKGFGGVETMDDPECFKSWEDFLMSYLNSIENRFKEASQFDWASECQTNIRFLYNRGREAFFNIRPIAFHEDLTHRNFLVFKGHISGVIDYDEISFGDPIFAISHMHVGLEMCGHSSDIASHALNLYSSDQSSRFRSELYKILFYYLEISHYFQVPTLESQRFELLKRNLAQTLVFSGVTSKQTSNCNL